MSKVLPKALILVNIQNDFFAGGACPIPNAQQIIPIINNLRSKIFDIVILSRLWHPLNHW